MGAVLEAEDFYRGFGRITTGGPQISEFFARYSKRFLKEGVDALARLDLNKEVEVMRTQLGLLGAFLAIGRFLESADSQRPKQVMGAENVAKRHRGA